MPLIALLLIALPLIEIAGFAFVGGLIGVMPTLALVVATTLLGGVLLRVQGLGALGRIRRTLEEGGAQGRDPGREVVHGLMIALAGLLLVIPGFFTDILGLLLFLPPLRELVWRFLKARIVVVDATADRGPRRGEARTIDLDSEVFSRRDPRSGWRLPPDDV